MYKWENDHILSVFPSLLLSFHYFSNHLVGVVVTHVDYISIMLLLLMLVWTLTSIHITGCGVTVACVCTTIRFILTGNGALHEDVYLLCSMLLLLDEIYLHMCGYICMEVNTINIWRWKDWHDVLVAVSLLHPKQINWRSDPISLIKCNVVIIVLYSRSIQNVWPSTL